MNLMNFIVLILSVVKIKGSLANFTFKTRDNNIENDKRCDKQLKLFDDALSTREVWALRLFDSWSKISSGYLEGNLHNVGSFSECINFRHEVDESEIIQGKYCLMNVQALPNSTFDHNNGEFDWREIGSIVRNQRINLFIAICLPASCSQETVLQYANEKMFSTADLIATSATCQTNDGPKWKTVDYVAIITLSFFTLLLIASTIYEICTTHNGNKPNQLFIVFSAYTNGAKLFEIKPNKHPNVISCLDGLRGVSVLWIIFGHRIFLQRYKPITNSKAMLEHFNHFYSATFSAFDLAVDTFLVMGAMLMTLSVLAALDRKSLNIPKLILHRYLRYTPVLAVAVLYHISIRQMIVQGPLAGTSVRDRCEKYWWTTLLHIQNYVNPGTMCVSHSWYLSADFQLFVLSPLFIYPVWKYGRKFLWNLAILTLFSSVYVLVLCLDRGYRIESNDSVLFRSYVTSVYFQTHARMGPWLLGILLGYALYTTKNRKIVVNKALNAALWVLSISLMIAIVLMMQSLSVPGEQTSLTFNAIYIAYNRILWAAAICWIIFACYKLQTGGVVQWFLSLPQWQLIARMSLSMYLSHYLYIESHISNNRDVITFEIWGTMHNFWGDVMITLIISTYLYLTFEVPFMLVEKYFYDKRKAENVVSSLKD